MQPQLQRLEGLAGDDDFAVEDEAIGLQPGQPGGDLREEAAERLLVLRLQIDAVAVAEGEAAEAVVFRFVEPALAARQLVDRLGLHRLRAERDRQRHGSGSRLRGLLEERCS